MLNFALLSGYGFPGGVAAAVTAAEAFRARNGQSGTESRRLCEEDTDGSTIKCQDKITKVNLCERLKISVLTSSQNSVDFS